MFSPKDLVKMMGPNTASYLEMESELGTLEPGKWADYIVLDRDYFTIPEEEIPKIKVLMTGVGGKGLHLAPEFAKEIGMDAVGPTTWKESIPAGWEPKPY